MYLVEKLVKKKKNETANAYRFNINGFTSAARFRGFMDYYITLIISFSSSFFIVIINIIFFSLKSVRAQIELRYWVTVSLKKILDIICISEDNISSCIFPVNFRFIFSSVCFPLF